MRFLAIACFVPSLALHDRHPEYGDAAVRSEYERNVLGRVRWLF